MLAGTIKMDALAADKPVETMVCNGQRSAFGVPGSNLKLQISNFNLQDPLLAGGLSACEGVFHVISPKGREFFRRSL